MFLLLQGKYNLLLTLKHKYISIVFVHYKRGWCVKLDIEVEMEPKEGLQEKYVRSKVNLVHTLRKDGRYSG